jgi:hypothetical protein
MLCRVFFFHLKLLMKKIVKVKPFIRLLDAQHELQIFESLLALTNLSAESEEG